MKYDTSISIYESNNFTIEADSYEDAEEIAKVKHQEFLDKIKANKARVYVSVSERNYLPERGDIYLIVHNRKRVPAKVKSAYTSRNRRKTFVYTTFKILDEKTEVEFFWRFKGSPNKSIKKKICNGIYVDSCAQCDYKFLCGTINEVQHTNIS